MSQGYARVLVNVEPAHLDQPFDYAVPAGETVELGQRVRVRFGGRRCTGWVLGVTDTPEAEPGKIRQLEAVQGHRPWFDESDLGLFRWVAERYAGTLASVLRHALPARVAAVEAEADQWPAAGTPAPAVRPPCPTSAWRPYNASGMLQTVADPDGGPAAFHWRALPGDDDTAMLADLVARCLSGGRTALVLTPDPASPAAEAALGVGGSAAVDLRGGGQRARYRSFLRCREGHARVAVGERGGAFAPLCDLGLVVVADEASPAYKEARAPRHHAREVALARARLAGAVCVLTGDLTSPAAVRLLDRGELTAVRGARAEERNRAPRVQVADRSEPTGAARTRLAEPATRLLREVVDSGGLAAVVTALRGQGAALVCRRCGRRRACPTCDGSLRHTGESATGAIRWGCTDCGWSGEAFACPSCREPTVVPRAAGVERLAAELAAGHPSAQLVAMQGFDPPGPAPGAAGVAVMTRGSVVACPRWLQGRCCAVVVADADAMLGGARVDAGEDALRLWLAAARWTRVPNAEPASTDRVVLETADPSHAAVRALVRWDPDGFWDEEARRRAELGYPPHRTLVRLQAEAEQAATVAGELRDALPGDDAVLGPDLDGGLLVKSPALWSSLAALDPLRRGWSRRGLAVRIDVDPVTLD
jgi:primosomal protein N' (replication factor Y)